MVLAVAGLLAVGCDDAASSAVDSTAPHSAPHQIAAETFCDRVASPVREAVRFVSVRGTTRNAVECGEAVAIAADYLSEQRNTHLADIDGWSCRGERDRGNDVSNSCRKNGVLIVMRTTGP